MSMRKQCLLTEEPRDQAKMPIAKELIMAGVNAWELG